MKNMILIKGSSINYEYSSHMQNAPSKR